MATMVYDSDLRTLNENELVYKISNRKNVDFHEESTFEDFLQQLTPGRKETALAVIELYTRMKAKKDNASRILSSLDIYTLMHPIMANLEVEESWAIFMNMASRVIKSQRISKGGLSSTAVDVRVILKEALLCNAVSIALVHNHPSGAIRPSREDDRLTKSLADACNILNIRLIDHVIVADGSFYSYADEGRI